MTNDDFNKLYNRKNDVFYAVLGTAIIVGFAVIVTKEYYDPNSLRNIRAKTTENPKTKKSGIDFAYMRSQMAKKSNPDSYVEMNGKMFNIDKYARDAEKNFEETEGDYYQ